MDEVTVVAIVPVVFLRNDCKDLMHGGFEAAYQQQRGVLVANWYVAIFLRCSK